MAKSASGGNRSRRAARSLTAGKTNRSNKARSAGRPKRSSTAAGRSADDFFSGNIVMGTIVAFALGKKDIPPGWLLCDGTKIDAKYDKLIEALNTNGLTPNLQGRTLIGAGIAPASGTVYPLGQYGGEEQHTLVIGEMPSHTHNIYSLNPHTNTDTEEGGGRFDCYGDTHSTDSQGGDQPHNNMQPFYAVNYIIFTGKNS